MRMDLVAGRAFALVHPENDHEVKNTCNLNRCYCFGPISVDAKSVLDRRRRRRDPQPQAHSPEQRKSMTRLCAIVLMALVLQPSPSRLLADAGTVKALASRTEARQIQDEDDPKGEAACFSRGRLDIAYESGDVGPPGVGLRITDPRGRTIGYDLRINKGWQEMPLAQASLYCDQNLDTGQLRNCQGEIEICGPISGSYQVQVLPVRNGRYSITASAAIQGKVDEPGYKMTGFRAELTGEINEQKIELITLQYSREAGAEIKLSRNDKHPAEEGNAQGVSH